MATIGADCGYDLAYMVYAALIMLVGGRCIWQLRQMGDAKPSWIRPGV